MEPNSIYFDIFMQFVAVFTTILALRYYSKALYLDDLKYITFAPRFLAGIVDSAVLWPFTFIPFALAYGLPLLISIGLWLIFSFYMLVYSVALHSKYGQTIGKMVCKVRVVDFKTGRPIGLRQALLRDSVPLLVSAVLSVYELSLIMKGNLNVSDLFEPSHLQGALGTYYWLVSSICVLWFLAEVLTMLTNEKRRAVHDFIAGTVVVRTNISEKEDMGNLAAQMNRQQINSV